MAFIHQAISPRLFEQKRSNKAQLRHKCEEVKAREPPMLRPPACCLLLLRSHGVLLQNPVKKK